MAMVMICTSLRACLSAGAARGAIACALGALCIFPLTARAHDPSRIPDLVERVIAAVVSIEATLPKVAEPGAKSGTKTATGKSPIPGLPKDGPLSEFFKKFPKQFGERKSRNSSPPRNEVAKKKTPSKGSGFIIAQDGYILTASYNLNGAISIHARLADGQKYRTVLIGLDARTQLALLKIDSGKSFPFVKLGASSKVRLGEPVVAIGNPHGLVSSVSTGIISGLGRDIGKGPYDFLQTDAAINKGHSGGPLFNLNGEVIGVIRSIYSSSGGSDGIGFAVPSDLAKRIVGELKQNGAVRRGWLGVKISSVTQELAGSAGLSATTGALIQVVTPGSPAARSELLTGDIVLEIEGKSIAGPRDLARVIAGYAPDARITMIVFRGGQRKSISVTLGLFPSISKGLFPSVSKLEAAAPPQKLDDLDKLD